MAKGYLDRFDDLTVVLDEDRDYQVRKDSIDGCPVVVIKCRAEGLTPEMAAPLI